METTKDIRYEIFKDNKILKLLKEKESLLNDGEKLLKSWQKAEKEIRIKNNKIQKIKDKLIPLVGVYTKDMLKEFEIPISVDLDGDKIKVQIMNQIEAYKLTLLKQKEDGDKQNSNTSKELSKKT